MADKQVVKVRGKGDDGRVVVWDVDPAHPDGEVLIANDNRAVPAALTPIIVELIRKEKLEEVFDEPEVDEESAEADAGQGNGQEADPLSFLTDTQIKAFQEAGFGPEKDIRTATDEELLAVPGIGPKTVAEIRDALRAHEEK